MTIGENAVHPYLSLYSIEHCSLRLWFSNSGGKNLSTRILLGVSKLKDLCKKRSNSYLLLLGWHYMIYVEDVNSKKDLHIEIFSKKDIHIEIFRSSRMRPDSVPTAAAMQGELTPAHCISETHTLAQNCISHFSSRPSDVLWNNLQG